MALLEAASRRMPIPEKTLLNILKLFVIVPVFYLVLQTAQNWWSLVWAALILLLYPLFVKPLQYSLSVKYLPKQIKKDDE